MSDSVKKPNQISPESYNPKKPEILSMAKKAAQSQRHENLTENVLQGIPHMGYGNPSPVCYTGSVMRLMDYLNDPIQEDELFSLSGAALCFPWKEASNCDEISIIPEIPQRTFAALGYESEYIYEPDISVAPRKYSKDFYIEKIKRSIDCGRPVIGFGFTHENYTCLITGYHNDGNGLYLRAYWSPEGKPQGFNSESDQYFTTENWYDTCYGIITVGEKTGARLAGADAYRYIKESASLFGEKNSVDSQGQQYSTGFSSFDMMKDWLLDDAKWDELTWHEAFLAPCGILLLAYYRGNLFVYLNRLSKQYPGLVNPTAIAAIERLHDSVKGKEHSRLDLKEIVDPSITDFSMMRNRAVREKVAAYVERLKMMDQEIIDCFIRTGKKTSPSEPTFTK